MYSHKSASGSLRTGSQRLMNTINKYSDTSSSSSRGHATTLCARGDLEQEVDTSFVNDLCRRNSCQPAMGEDASTISEHTISSPRGYPKPFENKRNNHLKVLKSKQSERGVQCAGTECSLSSSQQSANSQQSTSTWASSCATIGTSLRRYFTTPLVSGLLIFNSIVFTAVCVAVIMAMFTIDGADEMGGKMSQLMADRTREAVVGMLSGSNRSAQAMQWTVKSRVYAPVPFDENPHITWEGKWGKWHTPLAFVQNAVRGMRMVMLGFHDGSNVFWDINATADTIAFSVADINRTGCDYYCIQKRNPTMVRTTQYGLSNGDVLDVRHSSSDFDPREQAWYLRGQIPELGLRWSRLRVSTMDGWNALNPESKYVNVLTIIYPLYNASHQEVGIGLAEIDIGELQSIVEEERPTANSVVSVIDREGRVVATSVSRADHFPEGCSSTDPSLNNYSTSERCLPSKPKTPALRQMEQEGFLLDGGWHSRGVRHLRLDGSAYYVSVEDLSGEYKGLGWKVVVLVPQADLMTHVNRGIKWSIVVSVALVVVLLLGFSFFIQLLHRPLREVVARLQSAAYLDDGEGPDADPFASSFTSHASDGSAGANSTDVLAPPPPPKKAQAAAPARSVSALADVASIQLAYWSMADELRILKGYIPEHVRDQLVARRRRERLKYGGLFGIDLVLSPAAPGSSSSSAGGVSSSGPKSGKVSPAQNNEHDSDGEGGFLRGMSIAPPRLTPGVDADGRDMLILDEGISPPTSEDERSSSSGEEERPCGVVPEEALPEPPMPSGGEVSPLSRAQVHNDTPDSEPSAVSRRPVVPAVEHEAPTAAVIKEEDTACAPPASTDLHGSRQGVPFTTDTTTNVDEESAQGGPIRNPFASGNSVGPANDTNYTGAGDSAVIVVREEDLGLSPLAGGHVDSAAVDMVVETSKVRGPKTVTEPNTDNEKQSSDALATMPFPRPSATATAEPGAATLLSTGENSLEERLVTVVVVNLIGFHSYASSTSCARIAAEHEVLVNYVYEVAKRCGGVLDTFSGDRFWVSFNAAIDCPDGPIAAALFACEVISVINGEAIKYHKLHQTDARRMGGTLPPLARKPPRFSAALRGATVGIATGKAHVGPLGSSKIRRHTIISAVVSEAAALERLAGRYPDCGVVIADSMIDAVEGYCQYLILDAILLPGSQGQRRRIASLKGPMRAKGCRYSPQRLKHAKAFVNPLPTTNPYADVNRCFNAFLEGRLADVKLLIAKLSLDVLSANQRRAEVQMRDAQEAASIQTASARKQRRKQREKERERAANGGRDPMLVGVLSETECTNIVFVSQLLATIADSVDGTEYRSPLGMLFEPR